MRKVIPPEADTAGNPLITPDQRLDIVPVTNTANSTAFGWKHIRLEDYADLPESDIYCGGMREHLLVYHYKALDGVFHHECAGERTRTRLETGQLSYIPAGADNRWLFGRGAPCALHVLMSPEFVDAVIAEEGGLEAHSALGGDFQIASAGLERIGAQLWHELYNGGANGCLFAETLATAAILQLGNHFGRRRKGEGDHGQQDVSRARDLIHEECQRLISLEELARAAGLSRAQLVRNFRRQYGCAPHQYLLKYRIDRAKMLLRANPVMSIVDLSAELGFTDQSHFHRHFRRRTGMTPGRFQALHRS